jgi:hypothetical protein
MVLVVGFWGSAERLSAEPAVGVQGETSIEIETDKSPSDGVWIHSHTQLVRTYPIALDALRAVLEDFDSYPRFIPRLVRTTVLDRSPSSITIRQRYEISILGYRYPTEYDLTLQPDSLKTANRWTLSWRLVGSDGSVGESRGSWTLEAESPLSPVTRVIHENVGSVRKRFPLQAVIMRAVAAKELGRSVDAVFAEALRRTTELAKNESPMRAEAPDVFSGGSVQKP